MDGAVNVGIAASDGLADKQEEKAAQSHNKDREKNKQEA